MEVTYEWAVYWQDHVEGIDVQFFKTEDEARAKVAELIAKCEDIMHEEDYHNWISPCLRLRVRLQPCPTISVWLLEAK
jgi:hypothetical protein